jgi:4-hydroxybenzoate polyprenyltransferase
MRPKQWTKNGVLFAGLIFSQNLFHVKFLLITVAGLLIFCAVSGSVYLFNDIMDREKDRKHPIKNKRPIASGDLSVHTAGLWGGLLFGISMIFSFLLNRPFALIVLTYFLLQILYSLYLKEKVILDVFAIASGFVLRVIAGAVAIAVPVSSWLYICTILLSLFLALSKRRHELILLESNAVEHRSILKEYSPYLLDQMISVVTASTIVVYSLYTLSDETVRKFHTDHLKFTIPFVLFGIFRYLYLIHQKKEGGSPERLLLTDLPLTADILLYALTVGVILYL